MPGLSLSDENYNQELQVNYGREYKEISGIWQGHNHQKDQNNSQAERGNVYDIIK